MKTITKGPNAVSNSGINYPIHVYNRESGDVIATVEKLGDANLFAASANVLRQLISAEELLRRFARGHAYVERGEMTKAICDALGVDYKTIKTADYEKLIEKVKGIL